MSSPWGHLRLSAARTTGSTQEVFNPAGMADVQEIIEDSMLTVAKNVNCTVCYKWSGNEVSPALTTSV